MKWIKIEDEMPDFDRDLLLVAEEGIVVEGVYEKEVIKGREFKHFYYEGLECGTCCMDVGGYVSPTHWMYLDKGEIK